MNKFYVSKDGMTFYGEVNKHLAYDTFELSEPEEREGFYSYPAYDPETGEGYWEYVEIEKTIEEQIEVLKTSNEMTLLGLAETYEAQQENADMSLNAVAEVYELIIGGV